MIEKDDIKTKWLQAWINRKKTYVNANISVITLLVFRSNTPIRKQTPTESLMFFQSSHSFAVPELFLSPQSCETLKNCAQSLSLQITSSRTTVVANGDTAPNFRLACMFVSLLSQILAQSVCTVLLALPCPSSFSSCSQWVDVQITLSSITETKNLNGKCFS